MNLVEKLRVEEYIGAGVAKVVIAVIDDIAFAPVAVAESIHTLRAKNCLKFATGNTG